MHVISMGVSLWVVSRVSGHAPVVSEHTIVGQFAVQFGDVISECTCESVRMVGLCVCMYVCKDIYVCVGEGGSV